MKLWHDPVWSKVIAVFILTAGSTVVTYFPNWWPVISAFAAQCYAFSLASTSLPNWLVFLLGLLALRTVKSTVVIAWQKVFPSQSLSRLCRNYTTDIYGNLRWKWSYLDDGQICKLCTFCPECGSQVYAQSSCDDNYTIFDCESCHRGTGSV